MKNVFIVITILGLAITNYLSCHSLIEANKEAKDYKFKYTLTRDSLGLEHGNFMQVSHKLSDLNKEDKSLIEHTASTLHVKSKDIKSITQVSSSTTDTFHMSTDTPSFNDGHLSLDVIKTGDIIVGTYTYKDTCWFTTYSEPKKILGIRYGSNTYGDVHFGNPKTSISGLNHISIDNLSRPKHWSIGPTIGVTYINKIVPYLGFGITYSIIKL